MLSQIKRISKQKEFDAIFKSGKSFSNRCLLLKILGNEENLFKLSVVVSAKVSKKAVIRNKIRRRIKEVIRKSLDGNQKGLSIVIVAKPEIAGYDFAKTEQVLKELLKKARL